jgi:SAM-dependent methyltransferase
MNRIPPYNFGVYHWQRRLRAILSALFVASLCLLVRRTSSARSVRFVATAGLVGAAVRGVGAMGRVLLPPPWTLERYKYDALASSLPFERAEHALDIGCGTGRSLVGLASHIPASCTTIGLDVFDTRVILGNAPVLARRNSRKAGIDVAPVVGDATHLPVATDSQDVVTACRVLHDLPTAAVEPALREAHRVCAPDGRLGVLELPITPDETPPEEYWRERVVEAGFTVETLDRLDRKRRDDRYLLIVAMP